MHFSDVLINWYSKFKRDLPWRKTTSPYHVWLSEIILQQTRVVQGLGYYEKFIETYPTILNLADASEEDVLNLWQGLGYYSRARNLHATAKIVSNDLNGEFPSSYSEIIKLKGIGTYTGAAIASFCFNEPKAVVDGNVYRVLSRYFNLNTPIDSTIGKKEFQLVADECLAKNNPAEYNQAIMEFGALQCTPKPNCLDCPLNDSCLAFQNKTVSKLPVKQKKIKVRNRYFNFLVLTDKEHVYIEKRVAKDIWKNLYQFPLKETDVECENPEEIGKALKGINTFEKVSSQIKHVLSHQVIYAKFWEFKTESLPDSDRYRKIPLSQIQEFPVPRLIEKYLESDL